MPDGKLQPNITRAWYIQLINCGLVAVLLAAVPLLLRYELGPFYKLTGFTRWWVLNSLLIIAYMVERTRYDWVQLRYMRLHGELSTSEFQVRRAHERFHRKVLVTALVLGFLLLMLVRAHPPAFQIVLLTIMLGLGMKTALSAWGDLRKLHR